MTDEFILDEGLRPHATNRQWEYMRLLAAHRTQKAAAAMAGVTPQVISKAVAAVRRKAARAGYYGASPSAAPPPPAQVAPPSPAVAKREDKARSEGYQAGLAEVERAFVMPRLVRTPSWSTDGSLPRSSPGTPVLFLSDIHAGEVVKAEEVLGKNRYDWSLMEARLETVFGTATELLTKHLALPQYDGAVVVLGGDMVSGEIHDELTETNEKPVLDCTFDLSALLAGHLKQWADVFGHVYVVGVAGNHGRLSYKPRAKGYTITNADYHTYRQVARLLAGDERFEFNFPLARDVRFDVAGRRFLLTHGDQFRGGDGMIGPIGPIMRGDVKKRTNAALGLAAQQEYDTLLCGHFHSTIMLPSLIVNGSLKGLDEYAMGINVRQEHPSQTLFTVHRKHGITWYVPVNAYPYT